MHSKYKNLNKINKFLKKKQFIIPKYFIISKFDFTNYKKIFTQIKKILPNKKIILRSSGYNEDFIEDSNAGKYDSVIIEKFDEKKIEDGLKFISKKLIHQKDKIIIQELIFKPKISGVIFSSDINNDSPYYIINFDRSGKTNLITSGKKNSSMQTIVIYKETKNLGIFHKLINVIKKFEIIFKDKVLDVEFAVKNNKIYIFQCRNLKKIKINNNDTIKENLINLKKKIIKLKKKNPYLCGETTYFSNMSDWNPAEILGNKPKPLGISLYKELITNSVWAQQRAEYGYKDVRPNHLLINLAGSPYIDLRTDLNSFLPANINQTIQRKLINFFLKNLKRNKSLHDKIEFEVIPTIFDADFEKKIKNILSINEKIEYKKQLKIITNNILDKKNDILNKEVNKLNKLEKKILQLKKSNLSEIQNIYFLIEECKKNGTLPFAGLARCAFISNSIIKSFVNKNILDEKDKLNFYESFFNISNFINKNLLKIKKGGSKKIFFNKLGHLRPLTYSIESKNYQENFSTYFKDFKFSKNKGRKKFILNNKKEIAINKFFKKNSIKISAKSFFAFAKKSTQLREYSKLIFTKCINEIFINLCSLGKEMNINRKDMEFVTINKLIESYSNLNNSKLKKIFNKEITDNKKNHKILYKIKLPDFIENHKDLYFHKLINVNGNFITNKKIHGKIYEIKLEKKIANLNNKVVLIENADPGYDFIFSHNIKGLITKYGGPNSHMAIRCMELGLPAVIGIGENNYNSLSNSTFLEIDCDLKKVNVIT